VFPVVVAIAVLGVGCVLYGIFIERFRYRVVRHRLDILPAATARPLIVLHLSDLHFVRQDPRKARFLEALPTPDVTVVTGDFLAEPEAIEAAVHGVRPVRGRLASWFVLGSNDYFVPKPLNYFAYFSKGRKRRPARRGRGPELIRALEGDGWEDLTNVHHDVSLEGIDIELLGLDDAHIRRHDLRVAPRRAEERFGFAVMHSPDSAPEAAALGYELIVAGHTHGGQVGLPFIGALVTNCTMPPKLASGLIRMGAAVLHISRGLGTSKYAPFRFWCRPEATYLELRPGASPRTTR
jgi:predicted MPP superfamily phosphohydrolase